MARGGRSDNLSQTLVMQRPSLEDKKRLRQRKAKIAVVGTVFTIWLGLLVYVFLIWK